MNVPTTPKKKGEEINKLLRLLNTRWGLKLPIRTHPSSPSKVEDPERRGERIHRRICYLFFKRYEALEWACRRFADHAKQQQSNWIYKPLGETNALPSRSSIDYSLHRESCSEHNGINECAIVALEETLLRFLDEAFKIASSAQGNDMGQSVVATDIIGVEPAQAVLGKALPNTASTRGAIGSSPHNPEPSSSNTFNADQDPSDIMHDLAMIDTGNTKSYIHGPGNLPSKSTPIHVESLEDDDVFTTPPSTPPGRSGRNIEYQAANAGILREQNSERLSFLQKSDVVKLPQTEAYGGKKRFMPDAHIFTVRRKSFVESGDHTAFQAYGGRHLEPSCSDLSRSFGSISTITTTTDASTYQTSPNTSFHIESAATSFSPSSGDDSTVQLIREQEAYNRGKPSEKHPTGTEDAMEIDTETPQESKRYSMGPIFDATKDPLPATVSWNGIDSLRWRLNSESSFGRSLNDLLISGLPFRQLYEVYRMACQCNVDVSNLPPSLFQPIDDYDELWSLLKSLPGYEKVFPEKSTGQSWKSVDESSPNVVFSGDLKFSEKIAGPVFNFRLKPLSTAKSNRLTRKFGGDRFFILGIPGLTQKDLPSMWRADAVNVRNAILSWLVETDHHFVGRTWRAFLVKPQQSSTDRRKKILGSFNSIKHKVFLFAVDGCGFKCRSGSPLQRGDLRKRRIAITINELLEWFMPLRLNGERMCLKLFSRLNLAVSDTVATIQFKPNAIMRTRDAFADCPGVRNLSLDHAVSNSRDVISLPKRVVMNDGCARISRAAAAAIAGILGIYGQIPSVFQGRIGEAKGVWMVDASGEVLDSHGCDNWIEITDSQVKFDGHPIDVYDPDPARLTFEVHSISSTLSASRLNYQLMPILIDRGVPSSTFERLLEEDLKASVSELEAAMDSALALRKWTQEHRSVASERRSCGGVEMLGGLPSSLAEKINWFVEHGFEPKSCQLLKEICFSAISSYCDRLEDRMNIEIGCSTFAFMIADPLAILEEGEVHLGFSGAFRDQRSGFDDTMLNNMDIIVARLPAHLPSDIQKVRAVFKPELAVYKDVIVFSSKGECSLAEKLSGGDYDGDRAWICWEADLVKPFTNAEPHSAPSPEFFGLIKDQTRVSDFIDSPDYLSRFLFKGFEFNVQSQLLGMCTSYHEALCYHEHSINNPLAKDIAILLGYLVDSAKAGLFFTEEIWIDFKRRKNLPRQLKKPAYRNRSEGRPSKHIIDRLVFHVAKGVSERALSAFSKRFADANYWDDDLNLVWKTEDERSKNDPDFKKVLLDLRCQIEKLHNFWIMNCQHDDIDESHPTRSSESSFKVRVEQTRERFLGIKPLECEHPMVDRWTKEDGSTKGTWTRLKASALWNRYYKAGKFPWLVCGIELGELKVLARGKTNSVVEELWIAYRLDGRAVKRMEERDGDKVPATEPVSKEEEFGERDDEAWEGVWDE